MATLESLPGELDQQIALNVPYKELTALCSTNSKYNDICNDNVFWHTYYHLHYSTEEPFEHNYRQACLKAETFRNGPGHQLTNYVSTRYDMMLKEVLAQNPEYRIDASELYEVVTPLSVWKLYIYQPTSPCLSLLCDRFSWTKGDSQVLTNPRVARGGDITEIEVFLSLLHTGINLQHRFLFDAVLAKYIQYRPGGIGTFEDQALHIRYYLAHYRLVTNQASMKDLEDIYKYDGDDEPTERVLLYRICAVGAYTALDLYSSKWGLNLSSIERYHVFAYACQSTVEFLQYIGTLLSDDDMQGLPRYIRTEDGPHFLNWCSLDVLEYLYSSRYAVFCIWQALQIDQGLFDSGSELNVYRRLTYMWRRGFQAAPTQMIVIKQLSQFDKAPLLAYFLTHSDVRGMSTVITPVKFKYNKLQEMWARYMNYIKLVPTEGGPVSLVPQVVDVIAETLTNTNYRRVLSTTIDQQIVMMHGAAIYLPDSAASRTLVVLNGTGVMLVGQDREQVPIVLQQPLVLGPGTGIDLVGEDIKLYVIYSPPVFKVDLVEL